MLTNRSIVLLIVSNLATIGFAIIENWSLSYILFIYWCQSIIIGVFQYYKIRNLESFVTGNLRINGRLVMPTKQTQRTVASFFAVHYGIFHFVYLVFILFAPFYGTTIALGNAILIFPAVSLFFINHLFSYREHRERDSKKKPDIGKMMFFPYARIIPMHLTIILGGFFVMSYGEGGVTVAILFFLLVKTAADVVMHVIEHKDPTGLGLGDTGIDVTLEKTTFSPGEVIQGTISLNLTKPVRGRALKVTFSGLRTVFQSVGEQSTQVIPFFKEERILDTEKDYFQERYPFSLKIPKDILQKAENWGREGMYAASRELLDTFKSTGLVRIIESNTWYLEARLDIPRRIDISLKTPISIVGDRTTSHSI